MKKDLLIAALTVAGLSILYIAAAQPAEKVDISEIGRKNLGDKVRVSGTLKNVSPRRNVVYFQIEDEEAVKAYTFNKNLLILENNSVTAIGKVTLNRGRPALQVEDIEFKE
ncbi:MAG: hypothetical protein ABEJ93_04060 [Candidatus Nanohalobium sp.]